MLFAIVMVAVLMLSSAWFETGAFPGPMIACFIASGAS